MGPQEDKFAQLYKTFNHYNKEKQQNKLSQLNNNSEGSAFSFIQQEQANINKNQLNPHGTNPFVFKNELSEDNKPFLNKKHWTDNMNSKYSISNNSIKQSIHII